MLFYRVLFRYALFTFNFIRILWKYATRTASAQVEIYFFGASILNFLIAVRSLGVLLIKISTEIFYCSAKLK